MGSVVEGNGHPIRDRPGGAALAFMKEREGARLVSVDRIEWDDA